MYTHFALGQGAEGAGSGNDKVMNEGHGPSQKLNTILNEKNSKEMQGAESPRGTRKEVPTSAEKEIGYLSDMAIDQSGDDSDYRMGEPGPECEDEDEDELDINKEKQLVVTVQKKENLGMLTSSS
ncbi:hypothetical protein L208DRAFT_1379481 [Tricholoma matsutake]|nr:hypothetical protein L208DRAFT_1379481 [Tricholoma matsutake 945]